MIPTTIKPSAETITVSRIVCGIRKARSIFIIKEGDRGVISVPEIFYIEYIIYSPQILTSKN